MNCLDNVNMPSCVWFSGGEKRNTVASMIAGFLFFTGWWCIIDAAVTHKGELPGAAHVCGVMATMSLIMVNSVTNAQVRGETYSGGCMGPRGARLWLFIGFVVGFASLIAACWIMFANFVYADKPLPPVPPTNTTLPPSPTPAPDIPKHTWTGVSLFLQNAFIFAGSLVFKFGRTEDTWG